VYGIVFAAEHTLLRSVQQAITSSGRAQTDFGTASSLNRLAHDMDTVSSRPSLIASLLLVPTARQVAIRCKCAIRYSPNESEGLRFLIIELATSYYDLAIPFRAIGSP